MSQQHMRVWGTLLIVLALVSLLIAACSRTGSAPGMTNVSAPTTSTGGGTSSKCAHSAVHTLTSSFQEACVDIAKGGTLKVIPVAQSVHILANGSWVKNSPQPGKEPGAPTVSNVQVTTSTVQIGPFTTAGTFHLYCTVHPGMNLTVYVQ